MDNMALAKSIMESYPEASFCLYCTGWDYKNGIFDFVDEENGKTYKVTHNMVAKALPKVRAMLADKKLFLYGLNSGKESFFDPCNWDSIASDAVVQVALFGNVIYG